MGVRKEGAKSSEINRQSPTMKETDILPIPAAHAFLMLGRVFL